MRRQKDVIIEVDGGWKQATVLMNEEEDVINHPNHYTDGTIEVWDYIRDKNLNYFLGNAIKYISRAGKKEPDKYVQDLKKAIAYLNKEIENVSK